MDFPPADGHGEGHKDRVELARLLDRNRIERVLEGVAAMSPGALLSIAVEDMGGAVLAGSPRLPAGLNARSPILVASESAGWAVAVAVTGPDDGSAGPVAKAAADLVASVVGQLADGEADMGGLTKELLSRYEEITLLYDLSEVMSAALDEPALCGIAVERCLRAIPASNGTVGLLVAGGALLPAAVRGAAQVPELWSAAQAVAARVTASGKEALIHDGEVWEGPDVGPAGGAPALLSVPVVRSANRGNEVAPIGALTLVGRAAGKPFSAGDARLAASVAFQLGVAVENGRLVQSLRTAERVQREVEIAATIQQGLLPGTPPDLPGLALAGMCVPATNVGGDYYDFLPDGSGRLSLVVADVAGHSIGSALMMSMARAILRREIATGKSPGEVLSATNEALLDDLTRAGLFITAFCARYDPATEELAFANGGHNMPLLYRSDGRLASLDADGMPIGVLGGVEYEELKVGLAPGDLVLLYTDGVVEARNSDAEQFGDERLESLVAGTGAAGPRRLADAIFAAVQDHLGPEPAQDDLTLLALQVMSPGPPIGVHGGDGLMAPGTATQ